VLLIIGILADDAVFCIMTHVRDRQLPPVPSTLSHSFNFRQLHNDKINMKIFAASIIALIGAASAFTAPTALKNTQVSALRLSENAASISEDPVFVEDPLPKMSQSMPFMVRPAALTGTLAGDVGFDPFGFAKSEQDLMNYREAEIKHARLAMLAAAGWPISELADKKIAAMLNMAPVLDGDDRVPSILNGGLGKVSPLYWIGCIAAAAAIDLYGTVKAQKNADGYFPGNLGFDPFGVYPKDAASQKSMQLAEIKNGRLAMIAVTAFAVQEAVTKLGVVDETPIFFKPLSIALHEYANSGYIH